jgi:hypothetical protein
MKKRQKREILFLAILVGETRKPNSDSRFSVCEKLAAFDQHGSQSSELFARKEKGIG